MKIEKEIEMGRELGNKDVVGDYEKVDHRHCTKETKVHVPLLSFFWFMCQNHEYWFQP